ncbi:hypothetical protein PSACC_01007 [Paramicrosporidium saccamoebae]|uniref:RNA helicase n=1 Tax=Paramicrosporidium saccamoebae TaxID=1246581 RepID=A0A2H9TN37_9FUNG|nr:hypothetical protein PSACC_01007 [Paramicrosporidium saccamoebae]
MSALSRQGRRSLPVVKGDGYLWLDRLRNSCAEASKRWMLPSHRRQVEAFLDFRHPHEWYPQARLYPRTIYCHVGPTNSGKTHAAIQRLQSAKRGVYCAPLRLLAMEMWERLNGLGKKCALRTGEVTSGPMDALDAEYTSVDTLACTVEMLDPTREFDVAVIDEIQMISDEQRGWAFTQALLGVNAREVYVCGEEAVVNLIKKIAGQSGDRVEVIKYERLSALVVSEKSLDGSLSQLQTGDCVVAFSRKRIFQTKLLIEMKTGKKCAVVYGNLPMENRSLQAKAFNERQEGVDIMVASDAIGMGLNLIIFHDIKQQSSGGIRLVPSSRIKQIGGRAGRFGFGKAEGIVSCLHAEDMEYMTECMKTPNEEYLAAGLAPPGPVIEEISRQFPDLPLVAVLSAITHAGKYSAHFVPCLSEDQRLVAYMLEEFPSLTTTDRLTLSAAPVQLRDPRIISAFQWFVKSIAEKKPCPFRVDLGHHRQAMDYLGLAESFYRTLDLYLWLASRFADIFIDRQKVMVKREMCSQLVTRLLSQITVSRTGSFEKSDMTTLDQMLKDVDSQPK